MRHDSMISRYAILTGIPQVDDWSTGPLSFGASQKVLIIWPLRSQFCEAIPVVETVSAWEATLSKELPLY